MCWRNEASPETGLEPSDCYAGISGISTLSCPDLHPPGEAQLIDIVMNQTNPLASDPALCANALETDREFGAMQGIHDKPVALQKEAP